MLFLFVILFFIYVDKSLEVIHIINATIITVTCTRGCCRYRFSHCHKIEGGAASKDFSWYTL